MNTSRRAFLLGSVAGSTLLARSAAWAKGTYDEGATDTSIKLGHTNPYSGPASSYSTIGKCISAYWTMVNDKGGINGRKIDFITLDDGYSPPKTVERVRQLVEQDHVLASSTRSARRPTPRSTSTSTRRRCRSSTSPPAPRSGAIPSTSRGPWASSPTTTPRR